MNFINLTPHEIVIETLAGRVAIQPSGRVARVATVETVTGKVNGVTVIARTFGEVEGLPEDGRPCLVSSIVASAVPGRPGVYAPDTGPSARRDGQGRVVSVSRLIAA